MKKDSMRNGRVWPWKAMVGCVCVFAALVIAFGMRSPDNQNGWPEWLFFPGVTLDIVGGVLVYAEWREGSL